MDAVTFRVLLEGYAATKKQPLPRLSIPIQYAISKTRTRRLFFRMEIHLFKHLHKRSKQAPSAIKKENTLISLRSVKREVFAQNTMLKNGGHISMHCRFSLQQTDMHRHVQASRSHTHIDRHGGPEPSVFKGITVWLHPGRSHSLWVHRAPHPYWNPMPSPIPGG